MIYLDNAATTFPKPEEVYREVDHAQRNISVNIGRGSYKVASEAMHIADEARYLMAKLVGADDPKKVVFTPSATIASNEIIHGLAWDEYKTVYVSPFEHNAVVRPLEYMRQKWGIRIVILPFDRVTQEPNIDRINQMFAKHAPDYVFMSQISNVTGTILPVSLISQLAKQYNATVIIDGAQSVGLLDIDMERDGIDYLIFAGHKNIYASWGIGGFVCREKCQLVPLLAGGTGSDSLKLSMGTEMPTCFEPGSPNIIAIASLKTALNWINEVTVEVIYQKKKQIMDMLIEGLNDRGCRLYLPGDLNNHSSILSFNVDGYRAGEVGSILDQDFDIAVRTGYHCAPYVHELLGTYDHEGTVRASLGFFNTKMDIEVLLGAIDEL